MKKPADQAKELRHTVRDLVALSTTLAAWIACDPNHLAESVVDLLTSALRLDVAGIRLQTLESEVCFEAWRREKSWAVPEWFRDGKPSQELRQQPQGSTPDAVADPVAPGTVLRLVVTPLGVQGECGRIVVGSSCRDFPNKLDSLLLSVVANQAVTAFQLHSARTQLIKVYEDLRNSQQKELEAAAFIQQGLMAAKIPQCDFAAVTGRNLSCKEVGGDFFAVDLIDESVAMVIADVSGKGISSAIMASLLQGMVEADLRARLPLREIAYSANKFLCTRDLDHKYATLVIAYVQPDGGLEYINCGHVPPLIATEDGGIVRLPEHNVPVGLLSNAEFVSAEFHLSRGDRLIIVTDGITDAENAGGEFFGDRRLEESAKGERPLEEIFASLQAFCAGRPIEDDCTILELAYVARRMFRFTPQFATDT